MGSPLSDCRGSGGGWGGAFIGEEIDGASSLISQLHCDFQQLFSIHGGGAHPEEFAQRRIVGLAWPAFDEFLTCLSCIPARVVVVSIPNPW